ncbi:isoaspartyl peptidase/L-asparaginase [Candidatus Peregrinibacteria bacterium]|nr:MAG: isoaspartyl peptidase/L-asparaginase [Candidatus Peregrinibacteria bacterium]
MSYQIILHGGANDLTEEKGIRQEACERIADEAEKMLKENASTLDVCEKTVCLLENNPLFNAGTGSYLQIDGKPRMDACLMTSKLQLGAVIQITDVQNPISVARKLLELDFHSTLSGEGASRFAAEYGFLPKSVITENQNANFLSAQKKLKGDISYKNLIQSFHLSGADKLGTVGCVVRDTNGLIVAGTSTGGLKVCFPGRVGDSPLVGAGNYANSFCGVSCTGIGEKIMRLSLARLVSFFIENKETVQNACQKAITQLGEIQGDGGVIAISHFGEIGFSFNTKTMSSAHREG